MQYWRDQGTPPQKLNVGFAAYGRAFTLSSASTNFGAPASGPGEEGCYTGEEGFWASYEVKLHVMIIINLCQQSYYGLTAFIVSGKTNFCYYMRSKYEILPFFQTCLYLGDVTIQMITDQKVPYATTENQWVGFDNKDSLDTKVIILLIQTIAQ